MKSVLSLSLILFYFFLGSQNLSSQSYCLPSTSCSSAPKICMNGFRYYIDASNASSSNAATTPNCYGSKEKKLQQFIAFAPTTSQLKIQIDVVNPIKGTILEAAIFDNCAVGSMPLSCDTSSSSVTVGQNVNFVPGQTYILMIAGINGMKTDYQISVSPNDAIPGPNGPIAPNILSISGKDPLECPDQIADYSTILNDCAVTYNWIVESGQAVFVDDLSGNYTDNDPTNPMTNISITGPKRNNVKLKFLETGPVKLCVQGSNGCQSTSKVCKTITIKRPPDRNLSFILCAQDSVLVNDTIPGGPFPPGFPCRTAEKYDVEKIDNNGCKYTIKLSVTQMCTDVYNNSDLCECRNIRPFLLDTSMTEYCLKNLTKFGKEFDDTLNTSNLNVKRTFLLTDYNTAKGVTTFLDTSKNGVFNYNPSLITGKTYYISSVVGEQLLNGAINFQSPQKCLLIACKPIRFLDAPTAASPPYAKVCGKTAQLNATSTNGIGKWVVVIKPTNATYQFLPNENDPNAQLSVSVKGTYVLRWIVNNGSCSDSSESILNILDKPSYSNLALKCNPSGTSYTVNFKINGTPPYKLLKGSSIGFITGSTYISFPVTNGKPYQVFIKDAQNCDTLILKGSYSCPTLGEVDAKDRDNEFTPTDKKFSFSISPNPTKSDININLSKPISGELFIRNIEGKLVKQIKINVDQKEINIPCQEYANGYYSCQILYEGEFYSNNFIINKNL
ncbi:MAG: hypothetical protein IPL95_00415 [Saprospiraceae bacterium]|nr:hypothetical protein [Saprospiraceae bacterium]